MKDAPATPARRGRQQLTHGVVAFVPVRLNSQRVPNKSVVELGGRPLFCWCLAQLDTLGIPVYVYSSACSYLEQLMDFTASNVRFLDRDRRFDDDLTTGIEIYRAFRAEVPADVYLLAHATSPFVSAATYAKCLAAVTSGADSSATVREIRSFAWYEGRPLNFTLPRPRTQDLLPVQVETSAAFCYRSQVLSGGARSGSKHEMIASSPIESLDLDTCDDLELARAVAAWMRRGAAPDDEA